MRYEVNSYNKRKQVTMRWKHRWECLIWNLLLQKVSKRKLSEYYLVWKFVSKFCILGSHPSPLHPLRDFSAMKPYDLNVQKCTRTIWLWRMSNSCIRFQYIELSNIMCIDISAETRRAVIIYHSDLSFIVSTYSTEKLWVGTQNNVIFM